MFQLGCTSDKIWDIENLVAYLASHQHQDIGIKISPEAIDLENLGLYNILNQFEFKSVTIETHNPLEKHNKYNIEHKSFDFWLRTTPFHDSMPFDNNQAFLCLYHRPTAARLGLSSYLHKHHADNSVIHFSAGTNVDGRVHFELDKLLYWDVQSAANASELLTKLPMLQSAPDRYTAFQGYDYSDPLTYLYQKIFIDVVVESHVTGLTFFPTEKTARPMLLGRPFLIFGSKNYLLYLRQMGFRTFWQYWDEDYDSYEASGRLLKMYKILNYIGALTADERAQLFAEISPILEHNRNLLLSKQWTNNIEQVND